MKNNKKQTTFEEQFERLETIIEILDNGDASLEEMIARYEEGMMLIQSCREYLESAEQKIVVIQTKKSAPRKKQNIMVDDAEEADVPEKKSAASKRIISNEDIDLESLFS